MHYEVFDQIKEGSFAKAQGESAQQHMERVLRAVYVTDGPIQKFNDMMAPELLSCNAQSMELTAGFRVMEWAVNPIGTLHGGVLAAFIDAACGTLIRYYIEGSSVVTINLNINYIRSAKAGQTVKITASVDKCGRKLKFMHANAYNNETGKLMATASAQFI